ncbi:microtubule-destabilizing protein 60-like isoform X2 [Salvia miltiorrhiza]|uniref:microtubule-destabilizing protein 60-like isoform X2 n=1 Tax=Salvia miltiorrhiza TaxID=226208 RepID=UPI0025AD51AF|nr:microtubule-destabilizing protein 60-like isoform X2 [Salvia miltiorrhiza]
MESPNRKSAQKPAVSSTNRGSARNTTGLFQPSISNSSNSSSNSSSGVVDKSWIKENTKPSELRLHTQQRAAQRARYNSSVAIKLYMIEQHKKQVEKVLKVIEEEEVRMLRREMVPRAQLMPLFDKPFSPQRSTRPLTVPREPSFKMVACKHDCSCR